MYEISRRDLILSSAAAAALLGLNGRVAFLGVANAQMAMEQGFYRYRVGSIECASLYDGIWERAHDPAFIADVTVDQTKAALAAAGLPTDYVPTPSRPTCSRWVLSLCWSTLVREAKRADPRPA